MVADVAFVFANDRDLVALGLRLELCKAFLPGDGHSIFSHDDGARGRAVETKNR